MSDNVTTQTGTPATIPSGIAIATDDVGGVHFQKVKLDLGGDGVSSPVSTSVPVNDNGSTLSVDDGGGSLTVDGTVAVSAIAGSLPAGTNAIGKLAANDGVDIGNVDVASIAAGDNNIGNVDIVTVPADPFGANADAAVAAGAAGSIQAKLRRATQGLEDLKSLIVLAAGTNNIGDVDVLTVPADPFGANADAAVAAGASGSMQAKLRRLTQGVEDLKTLIVLGAGTNAIGKLSANSGVVIGDVNLAPQKTDDAAFTPGTSLVVPVGFMADETSPDSVDEGDVGIPRMTLNRIQLMTPRLHDGTTEGADAMRGNTQGTLLASGARTVAQSLAGPTNYNARGVQVYVKVTSVSGTGGLTIRIIATDPATGDPLYLNAAPTALTANGLYTFELAPGSSTAGSHSSQLVCQRTAGILPRTWGVVVQVGDASSYTYSIGYALVV